MLPIISLLIACQPCRDYSSAHNVSQYSPIIALLYDGNSKGDDVHAKVLVVLKGEIEGDEITVSWNYGMCNYPGPSIGKEPTVVFLYNDGTPSRFRPASMGCGPVQLDYDPKSKTIRVDDDHLTISKFKRRYK